MGKKTSKRIGRMLPVRIAFVENPATGIYFYSVKESGEMDEIKKLIAGLTGSEEGPVDEFFTACKEEDVDEEELIQKADNAKDAVKQALKVLNKWRDDFSADVKSAIGTLAKFVGYSAPSKADDDSYGSPSDSLAKKLDSIASKLDKIMDKLSSSKEDEEEEEEEEEEKPVKKTEEEEEEDEDEPPEEPAEKSEDMEAFLEEHGDRVSELFGQVINKAVEDLSDGR